MLTSTLVGKKIMVARTRRSIPLGSYTAAFSDHRDIQRASKLLGVDMIKLEELLLVPPPNSVRLTEPIPVPMFSVRCERSSQRSHFPEFAVAIRNAPPDHVIEWGDTQHTCCLDIDFHGESQTPNPEQLLAFTASISPRAMFYWLSRGGGVHLIYQTDDVYTADEVAAVAAYHFQRRYPQCSPELLHRTRGTNGRHLYEAEPTFDVGILRSLLTEHDTTDNELFLTSRGWVAGERHPHIDCPVNPCRAAEKNTDPVRIYSDHIYCYVCAKDGRRCGSKSPGYFPFGALAGSRIETQIARAVNNFVHWSHAKQILGLRIPNELMAKRIYSALLKLKHPDDTRVQHVFTAGEPFGVVRYQGYWCDYNGSALKLDKNSSILAALPQAKSCDRVGNLTDNIEAREWLVQAINLSPRGYIPVTPVHGFHFTKWQELPDDKLFVPLRNETIPDDRQPKYLADRNRVSLSRAWGELEAIYPKLDRKLVTLLLVARGCIEHRAGLPPMIFLTGPTGSGKTSHVMLAANIAGDSLGDVQLNRDTNRFNNELMTAKRQSGFVFFDEFFKFAKQAGMTNIQAMEQLLGFKEDKLVYMIYVGAVPFGPLPALIWADSEIPREIQGHEQIGRRVFCHRMAGELAWEEPLAASGISEVRYTRTRADMDVIRAMNTVLSHIIDEYFLTSVTDFASVADQLGFKRLRDGEAVEDKRDLIREFYVAFCNAPAPSDSDAKRFGKNAKTFRIDGVPSPLQTCLAALQLPDEMNTIECRALAEADVTKVLDLKSPARFQLKRHGQTIGVNLCNT